MTKSRRPEISKAYANEHFQLDASKTNDDMDVNVRTDWLDTLPIKKKEVIYEKVVERKTDPYHRAPKKTLDPFEILSGSQIPCIENLRYTPRMTSFPFEKELKAPSFETSNLVSIQTRRTDQSSYFLAVPVAPGNSFVKNENSGLFLSSPWAPDAPKDAPLTKNSRAPPSGSVLTPRPQAHQSSGNRQVPRILMKPGQKTKILEKRKTTLESPRHTPSKKILTESNRTVTSQYSPSTRRDTENVQPKSEKMRNLGRNKDEQ